jgi:hypothetical protein
MSTSKKRQRYLILAALTVRTWSLERFSTTVVSTTRRRHKGRLAHVVYYSYLTTQLSQVVDIIWVQYRVLVDIADVLLHLHCRHYIDWTFGRCWGRQNIPNIYKPVAVSLGFEKHPSSASNTPEIDTHNAMQCRQTLKRQPATTILTDSAISEETCSMIRL